ncbi:MAG: YcxB family protein [Roseiflexaceae bacterium]
MSVPTVRFQRNLRDVLAAAQLYQSGTTKHRIYQVVALILIAIATYQGFTLGFTLNQLLLIGIGVLLAIDPVPLILMTVTALSQPDKTTLVSINDQGVHVQSGDATRTFGFAQFRSIIENRLYCILVYGNWAYISIPRRSFTSAEHYTQFMRVLNQHLKDRS